MKYFFWMVILMTGQTFAAEDRDGLWFGTFGKKSIQENVSLWSEVQLRYNSDLGSMGQTLFRGGLLYSLNQNHELGLIMGYIQTQLQKEYRPTLQHIYSGAKIRETSFVFRSRLEFRDLEDNNENSLRYRLMIRSSTPISAKYDFVVWDEPFVNLTDESWTGNRAFERNRFFIGLRRNFEQMSIESGYLNQFVPRATGDVHEHLLVVYINY